MAGMVDTFLFLTLARTGDQLQGIKKGILEIADVVAVNKADGDFEAGARVAARELAGALRLVRGHSEWAPPVVTCSGLTGAGVDDVWERVGAHREHLGADGLRAQARRAAARVHLGARARRARPAAAVLGRGRGGARRRTPCGAGGRAAGAPGRGPATRRLRRRDGLDWAGHAPSANKPIPATSVIAEVVDKYADDLVALRRDLHAHPELSWEETPHLRRGRHRARGSRLGRSPGPRAGACWPRSATAAGWSRCAPTSTRCRSTTRSPTRGGAPSPGSPTPAATTCTPPASSVPASRSPRSRPAACCPGACGCCSSPPRRSCPGERCT